MASNKGKSSGKSSKGNSEEKPYRKIGSVWENKGDEGKFFSFTADDYSGELIFRDKASGKFFKVLSGNMLDPLDGAPKNLVFNISINLSKTPENAKYPHVEEMTGEESDAESQDSEEQEEPKERFQKRRS